MARTTVLLWVASYSAISGSQAKANWEWSGPYGKFQSRTHGYLTRLDGFQTVEERADFELEQSVQVSELLSAKIVPWATFFAPYRVGGDTSATRWKIELKEAWVEAAWPAWDIRAGNQIFTWARTDGFNPLDELNPRDMVDLLESPKIPISAARINIHPESMEGWNLELVASPLFRESQLPVEWPTAGSNAISPEQSRWLVALPSQVEAGGVITDVLYEGFAPSYPTSWTAAARLTTRSVANWDFGFSYINSVESEPRIAATQIGSAGTPGVPITIELHPSFHRIQFAGFDGATVIGLGAQQELGFRFEGVYAWRDNTRANAAPALLQQDLIKDDYVHAVAGLDYRPPSRLLGADWYFNLQYSFYERIGGRETPADSDVLPDLPTVVPWDRDVIFFTEANFSGMVNLGHTLIWSHRRGDGIYRPSLRSEWTESFTTRLGLDLFFGDSGFFGQLTENRRAVLTAEFVF